MAEQKNMKLLLIEDDPADVEYLRELLNDDKSYRFEIDWADRLNKGIERNINGNYDVILLDLGLPEENGIETFRKFRDACSSQTPVVVLTGLDDDAAALEVVGMGAQDYLSKNDLNTKLIIRTLRYSIERNRLLQKLQEALDNVRTLSGLLPICSYCKKIKDDKGYWEQVETYLSQRSDVLFTHGMCPDCLRKIYPDMADEILRELEEETKAKKLQD
ncbi:MAG: response regulator [Firmicutes bacterium]|nr:response regulator [Bacillota bacterium]